MKQIINEDIEYSCIQKDRSVIHVLEGDCEFYPKCVESAKECGLKGYALGYGYKYCNRFTENIYEFPSKGIQWVNLTKRCLMRNLKNNFIDTHDDKELDCDQIYQFAFETHPKCYVESGFCQLFTYDKEMCQTIGAMIKVFQIQDFMQFIAIKQIKDTFDMCNSLGQPISITRIAAALVKCAIFIKQ